MTIVVWRHFVNDRLVSQPEIAQRSINPLFWRSRSFKVIQLGANQEHDFLLVINLGPSFGVTPFEFMKKLCGS